MLPSELLNTNTSLIEISPKRPPQKYRNKATEGGRDPRELKKKSGQMNTLCSVWCASTHTDFKSFYFYHILKPTSCINSLSGTEENTARFRNLKKSLVLARGSCIKYKWIIFNIWNSVKPNRYLTLKQHGVQIAVWPTTAFLVVRTRECNPLKSCPKYLKICDLSVNSVIEEPHSPPWCLWLMTVS